MTEVNEEYSIDDLDKQLLSLVQKDALISTEDLGAAVGLSPTAAKRRLNKLRKNGTIRNTISVVDPKKLGYNVFTPRASQFGTGSARYHRQLQTRDQAKSENRSGVLHHWRR